jgi:hypothetical protein
VPFLVEVERRFRAVQGLPSPVRAARGLSPIPAGEGVSVVLTVGVASRDVYRRLSVRLVQLAFVELRDETFGVTTRYSP